MATHSIAGIDGHPAILKERLIGIQANTFWKPHHELDGATALQGAAPEPFTNELVDLHHRFGMRIWGGCCGTNQHHIEAVAKRLGSG